MKLKWFAYRAVWILLILPTFRAEHLCEDKILKRTNVSAELQSDVLLPCNFDPALLGSDKTADIAVQWKQIKTTSHGLLEISLQGGVMFWNNKKGRIKTFPKLSESGNFSILLLKVQNYDLSLYTCELINGSCSIGIQEVELSQIIQPNVEKPQLIWIIAGVLAGGIVLLAVLTACLLGAKRQQNIIIVETYDENSVSQMSPSDDRGNQSLENPVYGTYCAAEEEEGISLDTPVYATVKKRKERLIQLEGPHTHDV